MTTHRVIQRPHVVSHRFGYQFLSEKFFASDYGTSCIIRASLALRTLLALSPPPPLPDCEHNPPSHTTNTSHRFQKTNLHPPADIPPTPVNLIIMKSSIVGLVFATVLATAAAQKTATTVAYKNSIEYQQKIAAIGECTSTPQARSPKPKQYSSTTAWLELLLLL